MSRIESRIKKLEQRMQSQSSGIFLGEPGKYALVGKKRVEWSQFIKLFPVYTLVFDSDSEKFAASTAPKERPASAADRSRQAKKRTDSTRSAQK